MRVDDIAYQRATRVAAFGLFLQIAILVTIGVFGFQAEDTTIRIASVWMLAGVPVWLGLVIIFNQHRLERVEALQTDELQQQRMGGLGSAFETEAENFNVAARRLRMMHKWLMPIISWLIIVLLVGLGLICLSFVSTVTNPDYSQANTFSFLVVGEASRGWALAICLGFAAVSFITSRFVSGMSKQPAWQNLRGGAGWMVGNALVMLAIAAGIIFTYFDNEAVMEVIARALCWFMFAMATEVFFNFLLNLYRPRRPGEVPRPAFDSRLLSLLSAPDSIVRSINEAVNYQFGFDITSSWGYKLLVRATRRLVLIAVVILVVLNCMVIIEPQQQGVRLRGGEIVGNEAHGPGIMFKLPWPIELSEVIDVSRTRLLPLTEQIRPMDLNEPIVWTNEIDPNAGIEPFIVAARTAGRQRGETRDATIEELTEGESAQDTALESVDKNFALIETELILHYRIKEDPKEGLLKYLSFASDHREHRQRFNQRDRSLRSLALREVTQYLTEQDLDRVVAADRSQMTLDLEQRIQKVFDSNNTGIEVLNVSNSWIRPAGTAARKFESVAFERATAAQAHVDAEQKRVAQLAGAAGNPETAERIFEAVQERNRLFESGADEEELNLKDAEIEELLTNSGGRAAQIISEAKKDQWTNIIGADARLEEFRGRLAAYDAGPRVYREFLLMDTMTFVIANANKYIIGLDPDRMQFDIQIRDDEKSYVFDEVIDQSQTVEEGVGE